MSEPIFTVPCNERDGSYERSVYSFEHTKESIQKFYDKSKNLKTIFSKEFFGDFDKFCSTFFSKDAAGKITPQGLFWLVDDFVGMFYVTDIYPGIDAQCHYLFFDKKHLGREDLAKAMLRYLFDTYKFHRLSIELPNYASDSTRRFIQSIGFHYEGKKVKSAVLNGIWYDVNLYGLLRD